MYYYRNKPRKWPLFFIILALLAGVCFSNSYKDVETPVYSVDKPDIKYFEDVKVVHLNANYIERREQVERISRNCYEFIWEAPRSSVDFVGMVDVEGFVKCLR
jgi:hypothetical protein